MRLLIDADSFCFSAAAVCEKTEYVVVTPPHGDAPSKHHGVCSDYEMAIALQKQHPGSELYSRKIIEPLPLAVQALKSMLSVAWREAQARFGKLSAPQMYLTGSANFRDRIATIRPYKYNRSDKPRPKHLQALRMLLVQDFKAQVIHWYEADDAVAIEQTSDPAGVVVCGIDKDLLQVPGWHQIPGKGFLQVTDRSAVLRFYMQALSGDSTDGVPGCFRVGPDTAQKVMLKAAESAGDSLAALERACWKASLEQFRISVDKHGEKCGYVNPEAAALETAQLVYLLRAQPKDVRWIDLWSPP